MSKFKVGDKVRIRKDLKLHGKYGQEVFTQKLEQYRGVETVVVSMEDGFYELDCNYSFWCEEMLEPIISLKEQLKEFAIVKFRNRSRAILIEGRFYTAKNLHNSDNFASDVLNFDCNLQNRFNKDYDVAKFKNVENKYDAITALLQKRTIVWEWERVKPKKMTLAEVLEVVQDVMECKIEIVEEIK